ARRVLRSRIDRPSPEDLRGRSKQKRERSCRERPSPATSFADQSFDVAFVENSTTPRLAGTVALQRLERLRLSIGPIDAQHLPEKLAVVATFRPRHAPELA